MLRISWRERSSYQCSAALAVLRRLIAFRLAAASFMSHAFSSAWASVTSFWYLSRFLDQRNVDSVDGGDLPCLLVHFTIELPVDDQTAKVRQRPDIAEEVVQLFPKYVVQPADLVRGAHGQVQRQVAGALL